MAVKTRLSTTAGLTTREMRLSDYPEIAALTARNALDVKPREEWEHLWINNPVYKKVPNWPMGWVAEIDGEIVGFLGNIPISYQFKGREIISACTFSMSVDAPYRGHAIFLIKRLIRWGNSLECHFCTSANPHSSKLIERIKAPRVLGADWSSAPFWITNYREFLSSALQHRGWPKVLAYPGSAAFILREKLTKPRSWMQDDSILRPCRSFDERFEVFWEELQRAYPNRLLATRSREVLNWHFKYALAKDRAWIVTLNEGPSSRLRAYAIFGRSDNPQIHLKRVRLVDFQVLDGDYRVLVPMMSWALRKCEAEGIHMLEAFGFRADKQRVIDKLAPYRRRLDSWAYFYRSINKTLLEELKEVEVWDPSHFDGDASL
jgi:hypothetical protein